jgi:hypothetical protein
MFPSHHFPFFPDSFLPAPNATDPAISRCQLKKNPGLHSRQDAPLINGKEILFGKTVFFQSPTPCISSHFFLVQIWV